MTQAKQGSFLGICNCTQSAVPEEGAGQALSVAQIINLLFQFDGCWLQQDVQGLGEHVAASLRFTTERACMQEGSSFLHMAVAPFG